MKVQLILLVCLLANFVFSTTVTGVPQLICGMETVSVSGDVTVATTMEITPSVSTVAVSPSNFTLSPSGSVNVTITCNQITPVTFTVYDLDNNVVITTFYSYCKGMIYIQNPITSIIRGNDFETSLYLFPTPTSVVDITVKVDNPIVVPGSDRLSFGVGQNIETELFYVPAGEVGPVNIYFESRSLRDYSGPNCQELVLSLDVLGTITSDIQAQTIGDGVYTNVTVTLHPPALDTVVVEIDASNIGVATPSSLTFRPGQDVATFRLLPKVGSSDTPLSITFTADYYDTLVEYIYIDGTIFTSTPSVIPTLGVEDLHIAILPGAQDTPVTIYTTSSGNVVVPSTITFPAGTSLVHFSLDALSAGSGYVTFYAPGYISQTDYFTITDLTCGDSEVVNEFGTECLQCPMFGDLVCSGNGVCTNSSIDSNSARCECYSIYNGGYCQAFYNQYYYNFYSSGVAVSTAEIPGTLQVDFVIPSSIVSGDETGFLNLYPENEFNATDYIANAVNPNTVQPSMSGFTTYTLSSGFGIELVYSDNTLISTLNTPILATFDFDPEIISQTVFLEMDLCYYNVSSAEWVPSTSICGSSYQLYSEDLLDLVVETYLCAPGQYNFFRFVPIPQFPVPEEPVYVYNDYVDYEQDYQFATTGLTGVQQQQVPPQPNLPVYEFDPSPPRNAYQEQDNSSSFTAPSFIAVLFVLFSILF